MPRLSAVLFLVVATSGMLISASTWRSASPAELKRIIPPRAQVEKEHIETEFRTASGITDGNEHFIAGVVLITAGYAAEGKYSNYLIVGAPIQVGNLALKSGSYVFGWRHKSEDDLDVRFYEAESGTLLGSVDAKRSSRTGRIESFRISPPGEKPTIQIGRFAMTYSLVNGTGN
jgi:hypothetical protein